VAPRGLSTRPTSDRVREALFMSLEPLTGTRVADLFAGSGALGIEALSRGASRVDFVEASALARGALEANLERLGLADVATVWPLELPQGLKRMKGPLGAADLVLLDPPYGGGLATATLESLGRPGVLRTDTRVVAEHHVKDPLPEQVGGLACERRRRYGETMVSFYRCTERSASEAEEKRP